jgi:SMC interacting uncharacterized protein involved in chromosome segregation
MDKFLAWIEGNWIDILAYLGIGGLSGIAGKQIKDKAQDRKIEQLNSDMVKVNEKINVVELSLTALKVGLDKNAVMDESFRNIQEERHMDLKQTLIDLKSQNTEMMNKLFNLVQR